MGILGRLKKRKTAGIFFAIAILLGAFQNCSSPVNHGSSQAASTQNNGQPYDGKLYVETGAQCADGSDVHAKIRTESETSARLEKDNCVQLTNPVVLGPGDFNIDAADARILNYQSRRFVRVDSPAQPVAPSLVTNGSFENGSAGFAYYGTAKIVSSGQYSGAGALHLSVDFAGAEGSFPIIAGASYTGQVFARHTGNEVSAFGCKFRNAAGTVIFEQNIPITSATYSQLTFSCTVPANATEGAFYVWKDFGNGETFADDFSVTRD